MKYIKKTKVKSSKDLQEVLKEVSVLRKEIKNKEKHRLLVNMDISTFQKLEEIAKKEDLYKSEVIRGLIWTY